MADTQGDGDGRHVAFENRARPLKWIAMKALGSYVARTWRGDIIARPMNADGSMSTSVDEETSVETNDDHYAQIRAFIVAETGEFPRLPEDAVMMVVDTVRDAIKRTIDWTIIDVPGGHRIAAKCAACGGDNGTEFPQPNPWPCIHCGTPIIRAALKTVGEIRRALIPFSDDQIVVMDVDLEQCHSDRNVMHVAGIRPDIVVEGAAPWVFMDAGEHAAP